MSTTRRRMSTKLEGKAEECRLIYLAACQKMKSPKTKPANTLAHSHLPHSPYLSLSFFLLLILSLYRCPCAIIKKHFSAVRFGLMYLKFYYNIPHTLLRRVVDMFRCSRYCCIVCCYCCCSAIVRVRRSSFVLSLLITQGTVLHWTYCNKVTVYVREKER